MSRVFWDTNLFIYLLENTQGLADQVAELLARMAERGDQLLTSTLTIGETLAKPINAGDAALGERYRAFFKSSALTIISYDEECAYHYAEIRAKRTVRPPDAIQLACAARASCDLFITNNRRLSREVVPGIQFIVELARAPI